MTYSRFEQLPIWIESKDFLNKIYKLIDESERLRKNYALADQLRRCSCSVPLNIAEGFERGSNAEFAQFINIAKGSAGEARTILYIIQDNNYAPSKTVLELLRDSVVISSHLGSFKKFLNTHRSRKR